MAAHRYNDGYYILAIYTGDDDEDYDDDDDDDDDDCDCNDCDCDCNGDYGFEIIHDIFSHFYFENRVFCYEIPLIFMLLPLALFFIFIIAFLLF